MAGGNVSAKEGVQKITDTFPSSSAMLHKEVHGNNVADFDFWLVKIPSASQGSVDNIPKPRFAQKVQCRDCKNTYFRTKTRNIVK
jgi:hypothetical protein